ncbi:MAG: MmgE/PrpD family protein [Candidatus Binatia bacterium]
MANHAQQLADFVHDTRFDQLPPEVVDYTKLVILDSLICGIAAAPLERSKMMRAIVEPLGGPPEASVFGLPRRAPALYAAMANAEMMNLLDADDTLFTSNHFAVFNVAAGLAEAQRLGRSGTDLIRAVAVGFDINTRLNLGLLLMDEVDGKFQWSSMAGMGFAAFGTAASAAAVVGLDREQTRNLFGLAGWLAPTAVTNDMATRREFETMKYGNYAGAAHAGMLAVRMAAQGYTGDQACLDRRPGFMGAQGGLRTDYELMVSELGRKWWILETSIKYYPSCRFTHGPIDMLQKLMREEGLQAADIERIEIYMNPMAYALGPFREPATSVAPDHRAPLNGAFNIPYVMALVALGRRPGPRWYAKENLTDPQVWALASRIHTAVDEDGKDEVTRAFRETRIRRFRKTRGALGVWARGKQYRCTTEYCDGDPWIADTRPTWERVARKFHDFCDDFVDGRRIDETVQRIQTLENVSDVSRDLCVP